jgi:hypothetical protein
MFSEEDKLVTKNRGEVFPVHGVRAYVGRNCIAPLYLNLGSRLR